MIVTKPRKEEIISMLKIRLQGTKRDIRSFMKRMERDKKWRIENISEFRSDSRTNEKYKRLYIDVYKINN